MFENFEQVEAFIASRKSLGMKPGLDRVKALLSLVNNPEKRMRAIHVAGTNGKGSTIQFLKDALKAEGYQVGVFTSPSMTGVTGHIVLNDSNIPEKTFLELLNAIHPAIMQLDRQSQAPTEFEIITVLAFMYFSNNTDIALIEAGMGGRGDTTNVFSPILSIITNVARDHTAFLGDTTAEIAYQKAGIIKKHAPVISGHMDKEALHVIEKEARLHESQFYQLGRDFSYTDPEKNQAIQKFSWHRDNDYSASIAIRMQGEHQIKNASIAYMALIQLNDLGYVLDLKRATIAIENTQVPGRFEVIQRDPVIIIDGAHNPAGIQGFIETVEENYQAKERHLLFAAFKDKELETMLNQLSTHFSSITLTSFDHPRAAQADALYQATKAVEKKICNDWEEAIKKMLEHKNHYYFITGSLNFIASVRKYVKQ
ncbi:bifunctional folylpolyglutamate synthase/dihydrofolate synthase [Virgibacillus sp. NKC19-16]|uniref:bifunctional folylpolyglutamate synthase/dihydrofolate synthase n=1 Tax=Virgibacillus salidurans TaxID=2831673 RepID=UPI001F264E0C|nr:folylpolyglutamate synthase/dihydrofolate synthase family protein [Virgibacillus sp. NKC19-16]UJL44972.1 bifunctional folylpolyglutamate synthase/dihydrofolate synthase [Virgibacillus sp. NKC19-16]